MGLLRQGTKLSWTQRHRTALLQTRDSPTQNRRSKETQPWLHHRSSGIERVEKQTKRSLACVPIVRLHPVPSQPVTGEPNNGEAQVTIRRSEPNFLSGSPASSRVVFYVSFCGILKRSRYGSRKC